MADLDQDQHELGLSIVVLGADSDAFVQSLPLKDGELHLSEVHGLTPRLHFYTFSADPWLSEQESAELTNVLPKLDALVLTDGLVAGKHYSSAAIERLVRTRQPPHPFPVAVFGGPALAEEWQTLSAVPPVWSAEPKPENALLAIKALLKILLKTWIPGSSTAPPPTVR